MLKTLTNFFSHKIYKNAIALIIDSSLITASGLIFWILAANIMSPKDIGVATALIAATTFINFISRLGMDNGLIRYLPNVDNKIELYNSIVIATLIISVTMTVLFLLIIEFLSPMLSVLRYGLFPFAIVTYSAINALYTVQNTALIALRRADLSLIQNLLLNVRIPLIIVFSYLGVIGLILCFSLSTVLCMLFGTYILYRLNLPLRLDVNIRTLYKVLHYSMATFVTTLLAVIPGAILPIIIITVLGPEANAYYYVAYQIAGALVLIPTAVSTSLFVEGSNNLPIRQNVVKSLKLILLLVIPAFFFIYVFGDRLLAIFNSSYPAHSFQLLQLLAIALFFYGMTSIYQSIKKIKKDLKTINVIYFFYTAMVLALSYLLMRKIGLLGVGYALVLANILSCALIGIFILAESRFFKSISGEKAIYELKKNEEHL